MRAAEWEFRHRFWIIFAMFWLAAALYRLDPVNAGAWLLARLQQAAVPHGPPTRATALPGLRALFGGAAVLAALGAGLRTWAAAYLRTEVVHDEALHADRVVADGPYRHLRNPLYVGMLLATLALAMMMSRTGALLLVVAMTLFTLRLIGREEAALATSGGESYARFRAAVPALVPSLRPRLPASGLAPRWGQAFLGEAFFWGFALAIAVFAATLDIRLFLAAIVAALLLRGVLAQLWWRRRDEASLT